jgi:hypothetical protein
VFANPATPAPASLPPFCPMGGYSMPRPAPGSFGRFPFIDPDAAVSRGTREIVLPLSARLMACADMQFAS